MWESRNIYNFCKNEDIRKWWNTCFEKTTFWYEYWSTAIHKCARAEEVMKMALEIKWGLIWKAFDGNQNTDNFKSLWTIPFKRAIVQRWKFHVLDIFVTLLNPRASWNVDWTAPMPKAFKYVFLPFSDIFVFTKIIVGFPQFRKTQYSIKLCIVLKYS